MTEQEIEKLANDIAQAKPDNKRGVEWTSGLRRRVKSLYDFYDGNKSKTAKRLSIKGNQLSTHILQSDSLTKSLASEPKNIKKEAKSKTSRLKTVISSDFIITKEDLQFDYYPKLTTKLDNINIPIDQNSINEIVLWKVARYAELTPELLLKLNSDKLSKIEVKDLGKDDDVKEVFFDLMRTDGVRLPMASTILRFINPAAFQIIDQRMFRILYGKKLNSAKPKSDLKLNELLSLYVEYLKDLHDYCARTCIDYIKSDRILFNVDKRMNRGNKIDY